jgi:hypothetical protein
MKLRSPKRFVWIAAFLCIGCCAATPFLALLGIAGVFGVAVYFHFSSIGFFIISATLIIIFLFKIKGLFCKRTCFCKNTAR